MEWIADPTIWIGLTTLVVLEIVLGIDNLVFIAILADKLAPHQRDRARLVGLGLALLMRLGLLASISWLVTLRKPLFTIYEFGFSGRDLIMLGGGLFLLTKATIELHERMEPPANDGAGSKVHAGFWLIVTQIVILDAVFSIDSVITAVGMVDSLPVMMAAVIIAIAVMMLASKPLTVFVNAHPTVVILCLGFLMMIGFSLVADGFGFHIPKGYLYAAIAFSILIECFNQLVFRSKVKHAATIPLRQRTAEAVFRLLGGQVEQGDAVPATALPMDANAFGEDERNMVSGALMLGERQVNSIMTPRTDIVWVSLGDSAEKILSVVRSSPHSLYPVRRGSDDGDFLGYARAKDLMDDMLTAGKINEDRSVREALVVHESLGVLKLMDMFRRTATPFAFITDEYGSIEGLVTPFDMLEAIAGDFPEDDSPHWVTELGEKHWRAEGWADIRRLALAIGHDLTIRSDSYSTVAGYVMWHLGRLPELGARVEHDGLLFTVTKMERRRIMEVEIKAAS